jgi:GT2 family glycosyltransferase
MSMRVVAVVVSNEQPFYLQKNLEALEKQSFRIERTLVVDSSNSTEVSTILDGFIAQSNKHAVLTIQEKATFAELSALAIKQVLEGIENLDDVSIWLVHDDSLPEVHALAELVRALELSPLVAIASPKQIGYDNPKMIVQQGLTLTKSLKPFSLVNDELDQKQHDWMSDVLAVSSNAMLIRANVWAELGGFSLVAPELAADLDLGMRTHQLGFRVVVVPTARVRHAELSLQGQRAKNWLGGSVKFAMAKATNHLRLAHLPLFISFLYWLSLPALSVLQIATLLFVKRPDRILFTLRANLWAFFSVRARLRDRHRASLKSIKPLFATTAQVKSHSRLAFELEEQKTNLANFQEAPTTRTNLTQRSFAASGGLWVMLGLLALSFQYFPMGQAVKGGYALPLSDSWLQLFANTGASYQFVGFGLAAPSDPFAWVLLLIGSLTFFAPNLGLSAVLFMAMPLAYFGAWRLLSTVTLRNTVKIPLALIYVFWPAFTLSQVEGNFPALMFSITLPWLLFALARAGRIGITSSIRSNAQSWSWIAAAALLFAVAVASAPSALPLLLVLSGVYAVLSRGRFATAALVVLPAAALVTPYLVHQVLINQTPLALLADPTISYPSKQTNLFDALFGQDQILGWAAIGFMALGLLSLLSKAKGIFSLWMLSLLALGNLWLLQGIPFTAGGTGSIFLDSATEVFASPTPLLMISVLLVIAAIGIWFDSITRVGLRRVLVSFAVIGGLAPLMASAVMTPAKITFGDSRNLPAIFEAESRAGNDLRLLVISKNGSESGQEFRAELVRPNGLRLDSVSTAYRFSSENVLNLSTDKLKNTISILVGNLVSANGKDLSPALKQAGIGYVLVTDKPGNADLAVSLNSVTELDQVGTTEFGQLWRVKASDSFEIKDNQTYWSITKSVQLGILVAFILLALPTSRGRKSRKSAKSMNEDSFQIEEEQ